MFGLERLEARCARGLLSLMSKQVGVIVAGISHERGKMRVNSLFSTILQACAAEFPEGIL